MAFVWTEKLKVGVNLIDEQHKTLFAFSNDFFEACNQQKGAEQVGKALKQLDDYVIKHFKEEEQYMAKINYPRIENQKAAHKAFIDKLTTVKKDYETSGATSLKVRLETIKIISDWLINHVSIEDKKIGEFSK